MSDKLVNLILCIILVIPLYYFVILITAYIMELVAFRIIRSTVGRTINSQINKQLFLKSFDFYILTCFISILCTTLFCCFIDNIDLSDFSKLSFQIISIPFLFAYTPWSEMIGVIMRTTSMLLSMLLIFIFNYFIVLKKIPLPKKEKLISTFIITVCTSPYLFLFSCYDIIEFFGNL